MKPIELTDARFNNILDAAENILNYVWKNPERNFRYGGMDVVPQELMNHLRNATQEFIEARKENA